MQLFAAKKSYNKRREHNYHKPKERAERAPVPLSIMAKHSLSDAYVLQSSQSKPWMFGILVDRYQKAFLRKAFYILRSRDAAEDAVQETFLKIYKYGPKFSERENAGFQSWAYKVLTNTCYTYLSRKIKDRERVKAMDFADLDIAGHSDAIENMEKISLVQSIIARLPINLSRLLSLYFFEDKSYEEIALSEDLSLSAVRSGLHRAKKQFKNIAIKMI